MKPSPAARMLLAALDSADPRALVEAVEGASEALRLRTLPMADCDRVSRRLAQLAETEADWEVKKAIADASAYMTRDRAFETTLRRLSGPGQREFVQEAARRAARLRRSLTKTGMGPRAYGDELLRSIVELEQELGPRARRAAERLGHRIAAYLFRETGHEIGNVLGPLEEKLERMFDGRDSVADGDWRVIARRARDGARSTREILARYVQMTEAPTLKYQKDLDLWDLLREAIAGVAADEEPDLHVEANLVVEADRVRLKQAFMNVIKNAFESYERARGRRWVRIRGVHRGDEAVVTVEDRGCGIPEEDLPRIFARKGSKKPGGKGLGLRTFRNIIELEHNGSVGISLRSPRGVIVTVRLPKEQRDEDES